MNDNTTEPGYVPGRVGNTRFHLTSDGLVAMDAPTAEPVEQVPPVIADLIRAGWIHDATTELDRATEYALFRVGGPVAEVTVRADHMRVVLDRLTEAEARTALGAVDPAQIERAERHRIELRDASTDLGDIRGILSPNGLPQVVPASVPMVPAVAPAVQWVVEEMQRLREGLTLITGLCTCQGEDCPSQLARETLAGGEQS
jgi:hypothetical protein